MTWLDDGDLREAFQELRDDDIADAPAYRALIDDVTPRQRTSPRRRGLIVLGMAAAAGILLAAGIAPRWFTEDVPAVEAIITPTISDWTSPTASLLPAPDRGPFATRPILSSILDGATLVERQRPGVSQ